jgi:hypothetical protein
MSIETKSVRFDWGIKSLLRDKANFDVLEGFLSAVVREDVQVVEILDSESNQPEIVKKFNRLDIIVKDKKTTCYHCQNPKSSTNRLFIVFINLLYT